MNQVQVQFASLSIWIYTNKCNKPIRTTYLAGMILSKLCFDNSVKIFIFWLNVLENN